MTSVKISRRIPKELIRLLLSEESIFFPLIYNTRIVLNNTEVTTVGVAFLLKTTDPTLRPLSLASSPRSPIFQFELYLF